MDAPIRRHLVQVSPTLTFLALFSVLAFSPAISQTGTVSELLEEDQAKIRWESMDAPPAAGRLGMVVEGDRNLAIFRVLGSRGRQSIIQILDSIWPDVVMRDEAARLLDDLIKTSPPESASYFIWSGSSGRSISLDGEIAGSTPSQLLLTPGPHQILVDLPTGGKAGAMVEARPGESEILLLTGRIPTTEDGRGPLYLERIDRSVGKPAKKPRHLIWLEGSDGTRIYLPCEPITPPVIKTKVTPIYPELARRSHLEGKIWLYALLGVNGHVSQLQVVAAPAFTLASAATDAVNQWVYQPASLHGEPVPTLFPIVVDFYLRK
jgi:protein TonB